MMMGEVKTCDVDVLVGKNLLGFMPLQEQKEYPHGDWDNALVLYLGSADSPECYVLRTENQDYSMYDSWTLEKLDKCLLRDERYKAIGERIAEVKCISEDEDIQEQWSDEKDLYWLFIKTKTKELRMGHHWYDCHYPKSIWEVL